MFKTIGFGIAAFASFPLLAQATGPQGLAEPRGPAIKTVADVAAPAADPANILNIELSSGGTVSLLLRPDKAPKSVERLKTLAARGFYNGLTFHRVVPGFMAQGGDPKGTGEGGSELPDLKAEFTAVPFLRGTLGAARAESPDSANSQFFIMFAPRSSLDNNYTVMGRVVKGMDVVDRIEVGEPPANPTKIVKAYLGG